jgi:hypothetical protein
MIFNEKSTCLFFDQVNNYAKFRRYAAPADVPSTELSTVIVDKAASACRTTL